MPTMWPISSLGNVRANKSAPGQPTTHSDSFIKTH
jgi:hypothetical protein